MTTADYVRSIISEQLGVPASEVIPTARFREDLEADSLDGVQLALDIEAHFGLPDISEEQMSRLATVQDMVNFVEAALAASEAVHPERVMSLREVIEGLEKADRMLLTQNSRLMLAPPAVPDQPEGTVVMVFSETVIKNIVRALRAVAV